MEDIKDIKEMKENRKRYQASENFVQRKVAGVDVLISVGAAVVDFNGYIEINESAADLWRRLQEPCDVEELTNLLVEKYEICEEEAQHDVLEFIHLLEEHNMVVIL